MNMDYKYDLSQGSAFDGILAEAHLNEFPHGTNANYPTDIDLKKIPTPDYSYANDGRFEGLYKWNDALGYAHVSYGNVTLKALAKTPEQAKEALTKIEQMFPRKTNKEKDQIPVQFWAYSNHGPTQYSRDLHAPTWKEIKGNYSQPTHDALGKLMAKGFRPNQGGQLIVWHGEPGTGKTTALRALAQTWREWARIHYITDPERFFGDHADYMLQVMLQEEEDFYDAGEVKKNKDKWRVLILEDSGELLQKDAKARTGQALSRFLNSVDGLIGQGLRVLTLVTTNEELGTWHPAVTRHGRALAQIEFTDLSPIEGMAWLKKHKKPDQYVGHDISIADLYAKIEGRSIQSEAPKTVGFG